MAMAAGPSAPFLAQGPRLAVSLALATPVWRDSAMPQEGGQAGATAARALRFKQYVGEVQQHVPLQFALVCIV